MKTGGSRQFFIRREWFNGAVATAVAMLVLTSCNKKASEKKPVAADKPAQLKEFNQRKYTFEIKTGKEVLKFVEFNWCEGDNQTRLGFYCIDHSVLQLNVFKKDIKVSTSYYFRLRNDSFRPAPGVEDTQKIYQELPEELSKKFAKNTEFDSRSSMSYSFDIYTYRLGLRLNNYHRFRLCRKIPHWDEFVKFDPTTAGDIVISSLELTEFDGKGLKFNLPIFIFDSVTTEFKEMYFVKNLNKQIDWGPHPKSFFELTGYKISEINLSSRPNFVTTIGAYCFEEYDKLYFNLSELPLSRRNVRRRWVHAEYNPSYDETIATHLPKELEKEIKEAYELMNNLDSQRPMILDFVYYDINDEDTFNKDILDDLWLKMYPDEEEFYRSLGK